MILLILIKENREEYIMMEFNDYLKIDDEVEFNKLATEMDALLASIYFCKDNYTPQIIMDKITELHILRYAFVDLANKTMLHNSYEINDKCEVYIVEADYIIRDLRNRYNELNY
jgi:hypothetical protein